MRSRLTIGTRRSSLGGQQPREVGLRLIDGVGHGLSMLSPLSEVNRIGRAVASSE